MTAFRKENDPQYCEFFDRYRIHAWVNRAGPAEANIPGADLNSADICSESFTFVNVSRSSLATTALLRSRVARVDFTGASLIDALPGGAVWDNMTCADVSNSDDNGGTCLGHLSPAMENN